MNINQEQFEAVLSKLSALEGLERLTKIRFEIAELMAKLKPEDDRGILYNLEQAIESLDDSLKKATLEACRPGDTSNLISSLLHIHDSEKR